MNVLFSVTLYILLIYTQHLHNPGELKRQVAWKKVFDFLEGFVHLCDIPHSKPGVLP